MEPSTSTSDDHQIMQILAHMSQQQSASKSKSRVASPEGSYKEVERRRRETINDGINDLKKIVPGCEKNKGSILQRAVQYIQQLKEAEGSNIEKWTLEKLLTDQSMQETKHELESYKAHVDVIEVENEQLRDENDRLRAEVVRLGGARAAEDPPADARGGGDHKRGHEEEAGGEEEDEYARSDKRVKAGP
ncbi:hypothetical protein RQP46_007760 [Phenoliferia psychrophenolica]